MLKRFWKNRSANFAVTTAIAAVPLVGGAGLAVDYSLVIANEHALQQAADAAALAAAREMSIANASTSTIQNVAKQMAETAMAESGLLASKAETADIGTSVFKNDEEVEVKIAYYWEPFLLQYVRPQTLPIKVVARAKLAGSAKICVLGLDGGVNRSVELTHDAQVSGQGCGVYSNATSTTAITTSQNARITAAHICSSGGVSGASSSFYPGPHTDCPAIPDPLEDRNEPGTGACDYTDREIDNGNVTLFPGTYCGGLEISGNAIVDFQPGIYNITGDDFTVTGNARVTGDNVGFYLAADAGIFEFGSNTTIDLSGPVSGPMAGILVFESRSAPPDREHRISSNNANELIGTFYLPRGNLRVDSNSPVANESAYTAIIARGLRLSQSPNLVLNSDYGNTNVPVPEGIRNGKPVLTR